MLDVNHLQSNDAYLSLSCMIFDSFDQFINAIFPVLETEIKYQLTLDIIDEEMEKSAIRETHMNMVTTLLIEAWNWAGTEDHLYCYMGNIYIKITKIQFLKLIRLLWAVFRTDCREKDSKEIYVALQTQNYKEIYEFNARESFLPFRNVVIDMEHNEVITHNPEYYFTFCFEWDYDPEAECPRFLQAIKEMFPNEQTRKYIVYFMAYCMTARVDLQQGQIWVGPPGCGKSSLLEGFAMFLDKFAFRVPINKLCTDKQYRAEVWGRRMVWGSEIGGFRLQKDPINELKNIVTDGIIDGRKLYEHPINFKNRAKLLYSSNDTPILMGADNAFYERWRFIPFSKKYRGTVENKTFFFQKLFAEERAGIARYLIQLVPKLEEVLTTPDAVETKRMWMTYCSNTSRFVEHECDIGFDYSIPCTNLYQAYVKWCRQEENEVAIDAVTFEKYMSALGYQIVTIVNPESGKFVKHYQGVCLKTFQL